MIGWLIRRSAECRMLAGLLAAEQAAHAATRAERDDYRQRFIDKCEYAAINNGNARFSVTAAREPRPPSARTLSYGEVLAAQDAAHEEKFQQFLRDHPEEMHRIEESVI